MRTPRRPCIEKGSAVIEAKCSRIGERECLVVARGPEERGAPEAALALRQRDASETQRSAGVAVLQRRVLANPKSRFLGRGRDKALLVPYGTLAFSSPVATTSPAAQTVKEG